MLTVKFYIYYSVLLLIILYGWKNWSALVQKFRILLLLTAAVCISEASTRILAHSIGNGNPAYHFLTPAMALLFGFYYRETLRLNLAIISASVIAIVSIILSCTVGSLLLFPSLSIALMALMLISFGLFDLKRILKYPVKRKLYHIPEFWVNTGNIFFYSLTFFVFGLNELGLEVLPGWIYDLVFIANIVLYSAYGVSIYMAKKLFIEEFGNHAN